MNLVGVEGELPRFAAVVEAGMDLAGVEVLVGTRGGRAGAGALVILLMGWRDGREGPRATAGAPRGGRAGEGALGSLRGGREGCSNCKKEERDQLLCMWVEAELLCGILQAGLQMCSNGLCFCIQKMLLY